MAQVRGQYAERFEQRDQQHADDHQRDGSGDVAERPAGHEQRSKRGNRGQYADDDGCEHAVRAAIGRHWTAVTRGALRVDVLTDNDCIVDHESEYDDQPEQGDHRYRHAERTEHEKAAHEGRRDADADPDREFEVEHQHEEQEHESETESAVAKQQVDALAQQPGLVPQLDDLDAGRGCISR